MQHDQRKKVGSDLYVSRSTSLPICGASESVSSGFSCSCEFCSVHFWSPVRLPNNLFSLLRFRQPSSGSAEDLSVLTPSFPCRAKLQSLNFRCCFFRKVNFRHGCVGRQSFFFLQTLNL